MNDLTRKAHIERLKALVASYHGAQKSKKMAESQMDEIKPAILGIVEMLGDKASASTKRVTIPGFNVDLRDTEKVCAVDGAVDYVMTNLPHLEDALLEKRLNVKAVESAALDDALGSEDLKNLVETKSTISLYVTELKAKK